MGLVHFTRCCKLCLGPQNLIWACAFLLNIKLYFRFTETVDLILTMDTHSSYVNTDTFLINDWLSGTSCKHPWFGSRFGPTHWIKKLFWATTKLKINFHNDLRSFQGWLEYQGQVSFECLFYPKIAISSFLELGQYMFLWLLIFVSEHECYCGTWLKVVPVVCTWTCNPFW